MGTHSHMHTHTHARTHTHTHTHTRYGWSDGLFDITWSEVNEAILVAAAGDGNVLLFDQSVGHVQVEAQQSHSKSPMSLLGASSLGMRLRKTLKLWIMKKFRVVDQISA